MLAGGVTTAAAQQHKQLQQQYGAAMASLAELQLAGPHTLIHQALRLLQLTSTLWHGMQPGG